MFFLADPNKTIPMLIPPGPKQKLSTDAEINLLLKKGYLYDNQSPSHRIHIAQLRLDTNKSHHQGAKNERT